MTHDPETDAHEPHHSTSSTAHVLTELQLYGWRPYEDEPDPRPLPESCQIASAIADILDALVATLGDTRLEPDLDELLWGAVRRSRPRPVSSINPRNPASTCPAPTPGNSVYPPAAMR